MRSLSAQMLSASASLPATAMSFVDGVERRPCAAASSASFHVALRRGAPFSPRTYGASRRCRLRPSYEKRPRSPIHSSFTDSLRRGTIRITSCPLASTRMDAPMPSVASTDSVGRSSHERAVNAYGFDVSAPTGQRSITFPLISLVSAFSRYVPISALPPRPVTPRSCTPATSVAKRTQRVQWMHRVMTVLTRGPRFLSSTARFSSTKRPRSLPYAMDMS
mmetsp:Transcript_256/g.543  ORF Transcript_256/g.543 Transcript_256/m.543 type:complete len:220 (-) Transcript_256:555-1214(-)